MTPIKKPNVFRTSDGTYVNDKDQPLQIINQAFDDPQYWTYQDQAGNIYIPRQPQPSWQGEIRDLGGSPNDDEPLLKKDPSLYFHPILGAADRWKASMSNNTNPFVGLGKTFGNAFKYYMGGSMLRYGWNMLNAVRNSKNFLEGIYHAYKAASPFVKGALGAKGVDLASEGLTGNTWAQNVAPWTGMSEGDAELTNPGMFAGAIRLGLGDRLLPYRRNKLENLSRKVINALKNKTDEAYKKQLDLEESILLNPNDYYRTRRLKKYNGMLNYRLTHTIPKKEIAAKTVLDYNTLPPLRPRVSFTNERGEVFTDELSSISPTRAQITAISSAPRYVSTRDNTFQNLYDRNSDEVLQQIGSYTDRLNSLMGDDGAVAGSLISYRNGVFPVTEVNGQFLGPADTEIYTTLSRLPALKQKLNFNETRTNSVGGLKGTSPHTFRNTDSSHNGVDTEINIIGADKEGNAVGKLAHQIYRSLHPSEYSKMAYDYAMAGNTNPFYDQKLPISAEDLFQAVNKDPAAMQRSLFADMFGMETFTRPQNIKANKRLFQALFNENPKVQQMFNQAMLDNGQGHMGSRFTLGTDIYKNMDFSDVNANTEFLKMVYGLSETAAQRFAKNEGIMRNATNLYNQSYSTGVRLVGNDIVSARTSDGKPVHDAKLELFDGNASFSGGNLSGGGLNRALLNPEGGWTIGSGKNGNRNLVSVTQAPLTYNPEKIKTPLDLYNNIQRIQQEGPHKINPNSVATFEQGKPVKYDVDTMNEISKQAHEQDLPVNFDMGLYGFGYSGLYGNPIASGLRFVSNRSEGVELGSLLKEVHAARNSEYVDNYVPVNTLPQQIQNLIKIELSAAMDRGYDIYNKLSPAERLVANRRFDRDGIGFGDIALAHDTRLGYTRGQFSLEDMNPQLFHKYVNATGGISTHKPGRISLIRPPRGVVVNKPGANQNSDEAKAVQREITQFYKDYKQKKRELYELKIKTAKAGAATRRAMEKENGPNSWHSYFNFSRLSKPTIDPRFRRLFNKKTKSFNDLLDRVATDPVETTD